MKKLLLCMTLLAGMTFMACSSDDDNKSKSNCAKCTVTVQSQSQTFDVCKGDNGNAYVSNMDTSVDYETYIDQMCD